MLTDRRRWAVRAAVVAVTLWAAWLTAARLRISSDLTVLFPAQTEARALARYVRVFGGGDLGLVLLQGGDSEDVSAAAAALAAGLRARASVTSVVDHMPIPAPSDPTLAWLNAGPTARRALSEAVTPEGMGKRLDETRAMLLAPGSAAMDAWLSRDPLRLSLIPWENRSELAAGVVAAGGQPFSADHGRVRLLVVEPVGNAFDTSAATRFVADFEAARSTVHATHPSVSMELTGGHAIAHATAALLTRDLAVSGTLSLVLASLAFVLTFRRTRALLAVLPPLVLGTLWTTGLAALLPGGLSALSIAFTAVVVGVGVDTGVHVYAAVLRGRRAGLSPDEAARHARATTWKPTLLAAAAAGCAFASLALSELSALRQLGVLCGVGEVLTTVAILTVTPEIGALLERGAPPVERAPRWRDSILALTRTDSRAFGVAAAVLLVMATLCVVGGPRAGDALVAIRPRAIAPLSTQNAVYEHFGGRPGQWIVLTYGDDVEEASARADRVAEALDPLSVDGTIDGFDALSTYLPARDTERARLAERDALRLPQLRSALEAALVSHGFDLDACRPALDAFAHPSEQLPSDRSGAVLRWVRSRHLGRDERGAIAATYVRPAGDPAKDARALAAIAHVDPSAVVTGYARLEADLKDSLSRDLPRVALVALLVIALTLRATLGNVTDVSIALATLAAEIAGVVLLMRALSVPWHVYDALVLPVLLGVTIDEAMFLLYAARHGAGEGEPASRIVERAIDEQGSLVVATALTTAAGFAALLACRFDGLRDLGEVGLLGVLLGLGAALTVVPAGLRLASRRSGSTR